MRALHYFVLRLDPLALAPSVGWMLTYLEVDYRVRRSSTVSLPLLVTSYGQSYFPVLDIAVYIVKSNAVE